MATQPRIAKYPRGIVDLAGATAANSAAIPITNFNDWWEKRLPQETRKNVRRASRRGVTTRVVSMDGVLANLSSGLIYSPPGAGNALAEAAAKGLAPAAEASAQNPEPATLILLASALAITARRLRRRA